MVAYVVAGRALVMQVAKVDVCTVDLGFRGEISLFNGRPL
jgi:hypothetical protein